MENPNPSCQALESLGASKVVFLLINSGLKLSVWQWINVKMLFVIGKNLKALYSQKEEDKKLTETI